MRNRHIPGGACTAPILLLCASFACLAGAANAASEIRGLARNMSRGEPATDDEVILLRLEQGMQEEARGKTDKQGAFAFHLRYPYKQYLVRVIHAGMNYDRQVSIGNVLSIDVFDAAPKVRQVAGSIEILRAGTAGNLLHVTDMYEIENRSQPPLILASARTFDVYLPRQAKVNSVIAADPDEMGVRISATPVPGDAGHYAVNFPLRPGATKFAFNYDLPYEGSAEFQGRRAYPVEQQAVMIPPTMKFLSRSAAFKVLATGNGGYQVYIANHLKAGEGPKFEVSGTGAIPSIAEQHESQVITTPGFPTGLANPIQTSLSPESEQSSAESSVMAGLAAALLGICILLVWRTGRQTASGASRHTR